MRNSEPMKTLLLKLILLSVFVTSVSAFVKYAFYEPDNSLPWAFVSDQIYLKSKIYEKKQKSINTVFIGSSVIRRGFNPEIFDSLTRKSTTTSSFNFGVNWMGTPESFYMIDHVFLTKNSNIKYAFIEVSKLKYVDYPNLHTTRATYWYNNTYFIFTLKAFINSATTKWYVKAAALLTHSISFIENKIGLDYWHIISDFQFRQTKLGDTLDLVPYNYRGFDPLIGNPYLDTEINAEENVQLGIRELLLDTTGLYNRKVLSANAFTAVEKGKGLQTVNNVYLHILNSLKDELLSQGIYPIFVLAPRADKRQYEEVLPLFYSLDPKYRINIADSRKFPELYSLQFSADETHLNKKGAARFSEILAEEFLQLLDQNQNLKQTN